MTIHTHDDAYEPAHTASQTAHALEELQLYGYRPFEDEPDPRPMPDADRLRGAVADIFDALVASLTDTRMEALRYLRTINADYLSEEVKERISKLDADDGVGAE